MGFDRWPGRGGRSAVLAATFIAILGTAVPPAGAAEATTTDDQGLVAWYRLDETSGTTAANAVADSGVPAATIAGGAALNGADGVKLDGVDDYLRLPNNILAGLDSVTISLDVRIDSSQTTPYFIYGLGNTKGTSGDGYLFTTGDAYRAAIASGDWTTEQNTSKGSALARGVWKHVTYTLDDATDTGILYEDGVEVARNTRVTLKPGAIGGGTTLANYIGRSLYSSDKYLKGDVRDFRLFNRALSPSEVAGLAGTHAAVTGVTSPQLKAPAVIDITAGTVTLPVVPEADLTALAPTLIVSPQTTVSPANGSAHDFTHPVVYTLTGPGGMSRTWTVKALPMRSPVIPGYYADPNIVVFGDTYYIYGTTDGIAGWGSTKFEAWSSKDLVHWTNRGTILDLGPDVTWADARAWAPTATEKNGTYYFYYSADQNIGVAVSDSPTGPFRDPLGKPLVNKADFNNAQQIDPMVFTDDDGQSYLYWGNGNAYVVPLNADMISYDPVKVQRFTGLTGFREGSFMHKRNGVYYLSWSIDDTGSENYHVGYATGPTPLGPWTNRGTLLEKDLSLGIKGTGHHSVVQVPGTDEWYIAYHRFAIPGGDGTHRETTIDRLTYTADGLMAKVVPTLESVDPVEVPGPSRLPLTVAASSRCVGSSAYVAVTAVNGADVPATVTLTTPYGSKTVADVAAGKQAYQSFNARVRQLPAGEVTITGAATVGGKPVTTSYQAAYPAVAC
ncbi:family 43 glycosylhydrolase [Microbispora sp. CA-102843]|uniref:family 43 glycosylhydrolase n=1 Tax=Microbispora sp. CA-102843 TaxID=3239952 RepID=UPI003D91FBCE